MKRSLAALVLILSLPMLVFSGSKSPFAYVPAVIVPSNLTTITCSVITVSTGSIAAAAVPTTVLAADSNRVGFYVINHSTTNMVGPARPPEIILTPLASLTTAQVPALNNGVFPTNTPGIPLWPCIDSIVSSTSSGANCVERQYFDFTAQNAWYAIAESSGGVAGLGILQVCGFDYP